MPNTTDTLTKKIDTLKQHLTGSVTQPKDRDYDKERTPWLQVVDQFPTLIVNAANTEDVVQTLRFVRETGMELAVQNTGHGIALPCSGVLLRLSKMKAVQVNAAERLATIEPGVVSGELLQAAEPHGLAYASGQVPNVGAIGYTLGGGVGWLARKVGVACHWVQSATVVLADGSTVTASASENEDLFWALRGGGGNFGVVTQLTVKLVPVSRIFGGMVYYRMKDTAEILRFYRDWTAGLSDDTSTVLRFMKVPPKPEFLAHMLTETCAIGVCHSDEATARNLHEQIKQFKTPVLDKLETRAYSDMGQFDEASHLDGSATYSQLETLEALTDAAIDSIVDVARTRIPPIFMIELQHLGGALAQEYASETSYTAPTAPYYLHMVSPAMSQSLPELAEATKAAFDKLGPIFTGHTSYNFLRGDQQDRVSDAFGAKKYARLQSLKRKYDPANLFHINLNIPPAVGTTA